jgi:nitrate/nitrite-specific signal transduction histidine kinase
MTKKENQKVRDGLTESRSHRELKYLFDISQSLHNYLNIEDLILHIIGQVTEVMSVETVSVILHDEAQDELVFCWSSDAPKR